MLSKKRRVTKKDIEKIVRGGRKIDSSSFLLRYIPSPSFQLSPVVSKKISKKAFSRNRMRRMVYNIISEHPEIVNLPIQGLLFVKGTVLQKSREDLSLEIKHIFSSLV